jgi:hypothetical protein
MSFPNALTNPAQANGPVIVNENLTALAASGMYARNYATSTGLVLGYFGGHIAGSAIADNTTTLAASEANVYVVAHRTTGAVTSATNTTNWNATGTYGRLYHAVTGASTITTLTDWRGQVGGWFDKAGISAPVTSVNGQTGAVVIDDGSTSTALATSGSVAIDLALGDYFTLALAGNVTTFTFSNLPGAGKGASIMVQITQDSTPRTVGYPASFTWAGGTPGTVSTGSGDVDVLALTTFDNGTTWRATLANEFS